MMEQSPLEIYSAEFIWQHITTELFYGEKSPLFSINKMVNILNPLDRIWINSFALVSQQYGCY